MAPFFIIGIIIIIAFAVGLLYVYFLRHHCKHTYTEYFTNEFVHIPTSAISCDGKNSKLECNKTQVEVKPLKISGTVFKIDNAYQFDNGVAPTYPKEYVTYTINKTLACMDTNPESLRKMQEMIIKPTVPIKFHADMTPYLWNWSDQTPAQFHRYYLRGGSIYKNNITTTDSLVGSVDRYVPFFYSNETPIPTTTDANHRYEKVAIRTDTDTAFPIPLDGLFKEHNKNRKDKFVNFFIYKSTALTNGLGQRLIVVYNKKLYVIDVKNAFYKDIIGTTTIVPASVSDPSTAVAFVNAGYELGCFPFWMHVLKSAALEKVKGNVKFSHSTEITGDTDAALKTQIDALQVAETADFTYDNKLAPLMMAPNLSEVKIV